MADEKYFFLINKTNLSAAAINYEQIEVNPEFLKRLYQTRPAQPISEFLQPIQTQADTQDTPSKDSLSATIEYVLTKHSATPVTRPRTLSIGTGSGATKEYLALSEFFVRKCKLPLAEYTAIDLKPKIKQGESAIIATLPGVNLIVGDAQNLEAHVQGNYDVVMLRHPEPECSAHGPTVYGNIFKALKQRISPNSTVIVTSFWEYGFNVLMSILNEKGYNITQHGLNEHKGRKIDDNVFEDQYVIVARK